MPRLLALDIEAQDLQKPILDFLGELVGELVGAEDGYVLRRLLPFSSQ